jgi:hypothetical protein
VTDEPQVPTGSPVAKVVFEIEPALEQVAVQLHGAEAPAARLPMFTLPHAVLWTTTLFSVSKPEFVTVPEKVTPVPPTQPFEQVWLMSRSQVSIWPSRKSFSTASRLCEERVSIRKDVKQQTSGTSTVRLMPPSKKLTFG